MFRRPCLSNARVLIIDQYGDRCLVMDLRMFARQHVASETVQ